MKARILTTSTEGFYGQMLSGFQLYRKALRTRLGLETTTEAFTSLADLSRKLLDCTDDIVMVLPNFRESPEELATVLKEAREKNPRPLVFLDGHDQTSTPHFPVLPYVDRYIKGKMLSDRSSYQQHYLGGYIFSDFYSRKYGFDLGGWRFGSKPDSAYEDRIVPGWNFGVVRSCRWLTRLNRLAPKSLARRKYDINARIPTPDPNRKEKWEWYDAYRDRCKKAITQASTGLTATSDKRIGRLSFLRELWESKVVFSPFGWGEICMRDYECVASGALLVKPDCSHLSTTPNIFVAGETYVPVRWDLSDLEERIRYYLTHIDEAQSIATSGLNALHHYFERGGFVDDVARTIVPVAPKRV